MGIKPSRTAFYNFRDRLAGSTEAICNAAIQQAMAEGLAPKDGYLDGTMVRACASRHRVINRATLQRRLEELQKALAQDNAGQPPATVPGWMAKTPGGRKEQAERYAKAHEVLKCRLAENAQRGKDKRLEESKVMVSTSEPEVPLGRDKEKVFCPLYNVQCMVEPEWGFILTFQVFAQATDAGTLGSTLDATQRAIGYQLSSATADAAYASLLDIIVCLERGVELFAPIHENEFSEKKRAKQIPRLTKESFTWLPDEKTYACPQGHRLTYCGKERKRRSGGREVIEHKYRCSPQYCRSCPLQATCVRNPETGRIVKRFEGQELIDAHLEKMKTPEAQDKRKRRGQIIERCFGEAKEHRNTRRLHGRGLSRAMAEVGLFVLAQNALALRRMRAGAAKPGEDTS